ncbi:hypothetical protein [Allorhizocola rhizosphaerae]|uniref:hypothetical protein n=1 Tax=Allorhizocola rhizosphaerae TaxID=1872709 RepID=UPI000E3EDE3E|nr:hypothetical protein [Allorhizocola rhizosphaerae]
MSRRGLVIAVVLLAVVFGLGTWFSRNVAEEVPSGTCRVDDVRLDAEQMSNAATIAAVGLRRKAGERAITVALAAALQESKLRNLEHQGRRNDHDSIGLFQQRPSQGWGTAEQILDQRYAAERFYKALTKVKGWERMRVTDAAQAVQRSAYPEAYQKWADDAQILAAAFAGKTPGALSCEPARAAAVSAAASERFSLDFGRSFQTEENFLRVPVTDPTTGWQVAHWFVAQAEATGVAKVTFGDRQWTPRGEWVPVEAAEGAREVIAELSP